MISKIREKIRAIWRKVPKPLRSGWITAWITFTGTLFTILVGLLPKLAEAISSRNFEGFYDSLSVGAAAAVSAVTGFFSGCVNAVYRFLRPIEQSYQTAPPPPPNP